MFGNLMIMRSSATTISDDDFNRITFITEIFQDALREAVKNRSVNKEEVRLLKPINIFIVLDDKNIHFILSNDNFQGVPKIDGVDERGKTPFPLNLVKNAVERDIPIFVDTFGFSIPTELLYKSNITRQDILPFVESYIASEKEYFKHHAQANSAPSSTTIYNTTIEKMVNSQYVQAGTVGTQVNNFNGRYSDFANVIRLIKENNNNLGLNSLKRAELMEKIDNIEKELSASTPDDGKLKVFGLSVKNILEQSTGNVIATGFSTMIGMAIAKFAATVSLI